MTDLVQLYMEVPPVTRAYVTAFAVVNAGVQV